VPAFQPATAIVFKIAYPSPRYRRWAACRAVGQEIFRTLFHTGFRRGRDDVLRSGGGLGTCSARAARTPPLASKRSYHRKVVDKKQVALTGLAASILILIPVVANAVHDVLSGRWDDEIDRLKARRPGQAHREDLERLRHPSGRPLEQLVEDLRRLRTTVDNDHHRSATRQLGDQLAYDQVLVQLCRMVGVEQRLAQLAGHEKDVERMRAEAELERAGIVLSDRPGRI
jgi:hypothetical protein